MSMVAVLDLFDADSIRTLVDLRRRYRPESVDGADVFAPALESGSGLLV